MSSHRHILRQIDCEQATIQTLIVMYLLSESSARMDADARTAPR